MNANTIATLMPLAAALLESLNVEAAKLTDEQKAHNEGIATATLAHVKGYATASRDAEIPADEANTFLRNYLGLAGKPKGTAANYGRAVEGFRRMLDKGDGIDKATVKDAQNIMRSDEQVKLDAGREAFKPYMASCNAEQLEALLTYAKDVLGIAPKERKVRKDKATADAVTPEALQAAIG